MVFKYFPRLWGTGICDAMFVIDVKVYSAKVSLRHDKYFLTYQTCEFYGSACTVLLLLYKCSTKQAKTSLDPANVVISVYPLTLTITARL